MAATQSLSVYYISIPIITISTIIMFLILMLYIYKLYILSLNKNLMPFIHKMTTISIISCFICGLLDLYDNLICFLSNKYLFEIEIYNIINNCIYTIVLLSLFILFIGRLYYTFITTIYSLNKIFLFFIFIIIIISLISLLNAEIGYARKQKYKISIAIIIINDTILNIMCIIIFIYKLIQIGNNKYIQLNDDEQHNDEQLNVINILIRHSILSTISIIFNQIWYSILFYYTFIYRGTPDNQKLNDIISIELSIRTIYLMVNCIILYLNLNINHWLYYFYCKKCHLCCYNKFVVYNNHQIEP